MPTVDNRTIVNDCEAGGSTEFSDTAKSPATETGAGLFYQGSGSTSIQHSNADASLLCIEDSAGATFSLSAADFTFYFLLKDGFVESLANGGVQFSLSDGTNHVGFDIGGFDAPGMDLPGFFRAYKLDTSNLPVGSNVTYGGTEGSLNLAAITGFGPGTLHLLKAVGNTPNTYTDNYAYMANGLYAMSINGGTAGTPETMADIFDDDVNIEGTGMFGNPQGSLFTFFAPTEWGNLSTIAEHAFVADGEQWFWQGDHGGGHAIGAANFPFRLVSNSTDTGSFIISNVSIVATGTRAEFGMDNADFDTIEINGCTLTGLSTILLPSAGGTSRFTTNCSFSDCGEITNNGADMSGSSILISNAATDAGALIYAESGDPDGILDNLTFSQGGNAHHAIDFQTGISATMTLRDCDFNGFSSSPDVDGSVFKFPDGVGPFTLNLVNCSNDGSGFTVDSTSTVNIIIDPVTTIVNVKDNNGDNLEFCRVYLKARDNTASLPFRETVTITRSTTVATVAHTGHGMETNDKVKIEGIAQSSNFEDNAGVHQITVNDANEYEYTTPDTGDTTFTGAITSTWVALEGDTDSNGNISLSKTYSSSQPVTGFARKSTAAPRFKSFPLNGIINNSSGLAINLQLILDE